MMQNSPIRYTWDTREFRVLQYIYIYLLGIDSGMEQSCVIGCIIMLNTHVNMKDHNKRFTHLVSISTLIASVLLEVTAGIVYAQLLKCHKTSIHTNCFTGGKDLKSF